MRKKKLVLVMLVCCLFGSVMTCAAADEDINPEKVEQNASIEISTQAGNVGIVNGDGIRLRSQPSLSSTVLETMYKGEVVVIDYSQSNGSWYKVTRQKTGRSGWVTKTYITTM